MVLQPGCPIIGAAGAGGGGAAAAAAAAAAESCNAAIAISAATAAACNSTATDIGAIMEEYMCVCLRLRNVCLLPTAASGELPLWIVLQYYICVPAVHGWTRVPGQGRHGHGRTCSHNRSIIHGSLTYHATRVVRARTRLSLPTGLLSQAAALKLSLISLLIATSTLLA